MLRERSFGSVKIISLDRPEVLKRLRQIAARIITECSEVKRIYLFGSLAHGDHVGMSDVDLLISVFGSTVLEPWEQARRYYPYFDLPIGVDILVFSEDEIQHRLQAQDDFLSRLWREGIELASRD